MEMDKSLFEKIGDDKDTLVVEVGAGEEMSSEGPEEAAEKKAAEPAAELFAEAEEKKSAGPAAETVAETAEELPADKEEEAGTGRTRKGAGRGIYILLWILAPLAGTYTGLRSAVTIGIMNLIDAGQVLPEELEHLSQWGWLAKFASQHAQGDYVSKSMTICIIAGLLAVAAVIGLSVLAGRYGRDADGKIRLNWFDRMWSELHITAAILAAVGAAAAALPVGNMVRCSNQIGPFDLSEVFTPVMVDKYIYQIPNSTTFWYCAVGMLACLTIAVMCWISLVKKLRAHALIRCSLLGKIFGIARDGATLAGRGVAALAGSEAAAKAGHGAAAAGREVVKTITNECANLADSACSTVRSITVPADIDKSAKLKLTAKYIAIAIGLIALPILLAFMTSAEEGLIIGITVSVLLASRLIIIKVGKLAEIRAGVIEVKSGNLEYKIPVAEDRFGPATDLDKLASDINNISEATNAAVQNEIKNQRLKTDLISNVSHDLKTPLTSMISYLDILEKEGLDSPDAPAHLAIVREKTERLRTLTEELFEAAKASSGNIPCEIENIDVAALIEQSLAEMGDRLARKKLKIKKNIHTDNTIVRADGKLLYRVFENLLGNISKYALEKSRVYIDVTDAAASGTSGTSGAGKLLIEIKNISKDELNISADELMERFTRGDKARRTEGSGLGLAIAKDLTTLMGGVFEIKIDGDMFKASILLNRA